MHGHRTVMFCLAAGLAGSVAAPAFAQDANHMTACKTKSECDLYADEREAAARQAAWDANVQREQDYALQRQQLQAAAKAHSEGDKLTRLQEVMRRRREAAAAAKAGN